MKKYINKIVALGAIALLATSCTDDGELTTLATVNFDGNLEASPSTIVLTPENKYVPVTTISWEDVVFPIEAPVSYTLEFDKPTDTIGATAWVNATRIVVGEDVLSKSFLGADLNTLAMELGLEADVEGQIAVRAVATMDRTVYSKSIVLNVTPFVEEITITEVYMPGAYQGWNPGTASVLTAIENGVFRGYATFPAGSLVFKITPETNWNQFYGSNGGNSIALGSDTDFSVPAAGSYQITVNLNTMTIAMVPYTFGIIGTATAGGWDADTDMTYDHVARKWTFTGALLSGALKFRLNDAWTVNYGSANGENGEIVDGTVILDNSGAHTINEAGTYKVTFGVNQPPATGTYSVDKID